MHKHQVLLLSLMFYWFPHILIKLSAATHALGVSHVRLNPPSLADLLNYVWFNLTLISFFLVLEADDFPPPLLFTIACRCFVLTGQWKIFSCILCEVIHTLIRTLS